MKNNRRSNRTRLKIYGFAWILVMVFIFIMSAKDGNESGRMSGSLLGGRLERLIEWLLPESFGYTAEYIIRKCAHMFEYFCLGVSGFLFFYELFLNKTLRMLKTEGSVLLCCFLYACSDEWHQTFVPGRAGLFSDVLIDTIGFMAGILLLTLIIWIPNGKNNRRFP